MNNKMMQFPPGWPTDRLHRYLGGTLISPSLVSDPLALRLRPAQVLCDSFALAQCSLELISMSRASTRAHAPTASSPSTASSLHPDVARPWQSRTQTPSPIGTKNAGSFPPLQPIPPSPSPTTARAGYDATYRPHRPEEDETLHDLWVLTSEVIAFVFYEDDDAYGITVASTAEDRADGEDDGDAERSVTSSVYDADHEGDGEDQQQPAWIESKEKHAPAAPVDDEPIDWERLKLGYPAALPEILKVLRIAHAQLAPL
ncbi:hypothetical protein EXIGLDRAFT_186830 [Exidia glandulosa HHB12029]|uniref:Uncharacterized protein n=1 Tax=Exidia glandulosa HHB12029 TaxID=1314781 RepID=A0A165EZD0_EXIGL|nr:hypothetical protein EXIGLDRAFT_186830 [Exidia glandulosa HHB12029]